ncbi:MAG: hypothetical protein HQK54_16360 [Oligoflexales bacterium]|nr:hypothetical protein [Oligoflexales bacterium]
MSINIKTLLGLSSFFCLFLLSACYRKAAQPPTLNTPSSTSNSASDICTPNPCKGETETKCISINNGKSYICKSPDSTENTPTGQAPSISIDSIVGIWMQTSVKEIKNDCDKVEPLKPRSSLLEKAGKDKVKITICADTACKKMDGEGEIYTYGKNEIQIAYTVLTDLSKQDKYKCKLILDLDVLIKLEDSDNATSEIGSVFKMEGVECDALKQAYPDFAKNEGCQGSWTAISERYDQ